MRELTEEEVAAARVYLRNKLSSFEQEVLTYATLNMPDNVPATMMALVHGTVVVLLSDMLRGIMDEAKTEEEKHLAAEAVGIYLSNVSAEVVEKVFNEQ